MPVHACTGGLLWKGGIEESGIPWQYDMVVIDELSSFKSHQSKRFKSLMKARPGVKRMVGLTGTPSSNGLMDLWSEFRVLDMGKRLGRYITHYREQFFEPDRRNGMQVFSYRPRAGAEREIYRRIGDITISMRSTDYLKMPECVMNTVPVTLDSTEYEIYEEMERLPSRKSASATVHWHWLRPIGLPPESPLSKVGRRSPPSASRSVLQRANSSWRQSALRTWTAALAGFLQS